MGGGGRVLLVGPGRGVWVGGAARGGGGWGGEFGGRVEVFEGGGGWGVC